MNQNLKIIEEINPKLYEKISQFSMEKVPNHVDMIESAPGVDGTNVLYVENDGKDYRLNSIYSPSYEAERWADQFFMGNVFNTVVMFGLGNGYFLKAILKKLPEKDRCLVFEPSPEIFLHVLQEYDLEEILKDKRVILGVEGMNEFEFHLFLKSFVEASNMKTQIVCFYPFYKELFEKSYVNFLKELKEVMSSAVINLNTYVALSKNTARNIMLNIQHMRDCITIKQLKSHYQFTKPVVIVSAGPSVSDCLEDLRGVKGKAVILAVDRVLDFLLDAGIEPDFVVSMDPGKKMKEFSRREEVDIPMFTILSGQYLIWNKQKGKKILCSVGKFIETYFMQKLGYLPIMDTGKSVACFAFQIALFMGSKKIILAGQDLAYDGKITHAGGIISNPVETKPIMIEGIDGKEVASRYDWKEFALWFKDMIFLHPEVTVYDVKTHGAKIEGAVYMPFQEAFAEAVKGEEKEIEETESIKEIVDNMDPIFIEKDSYTLFELVEKNMQDLKQVKKKVKEGKNFCYDAIQLIKEGKLNSSQIDRKLEKIKEINELITKMPVYSFLDSMIVGQIRIKYVNVNKLSGELKEDTLKVLDVQKDYFEAAQEAIKYVQPLMTDLVEYYKLKKEKLDGSISSDSCPERVEKR